MAFVVVLITFLFLCISFATNTVTSNNFSFFTYGFNQIRVIMGNLFLFFLLYLVVVSYFIRPKHFDVAHPFRKRYLAASVRFVEVILVGFLLSFVVMYCIGFLHLNIAALTIRMNPKLAGVITDKKEIFEAFTTSKKSPEIVASDPDQHQEVLAVAVTTAGNNNFYGKYVLPSIPSFLIIPIQKPDSSIILVDNTLIVTSINAKDLQEISLVVAHLLVRQYFQTRFIKSYPDVEIVNQEKYAFYRKRDFGKKLIQLEGQLKQLEEDTSSTSAALEDDKTTLAFNQEKLLELQAKRRSTFSNCMSQGSYKNGKFVRIFTETQCRNIEHAEDQDIDDLRKEIEAVQKKITYNEGQQSNFEYFKKVYDIQKTAVSGLTANIPYELGVFEPPKDIKLVLKTKDSHAIADYFETLVHEYLHYASYEKGKSFTITFFEEGLTEYFARQIVEYTLNTSTNLGYPVDVKIIAQMTKRIPESELADIYFTHDQKRLEESMDRVYGDNFFRENQILFARLQYASDPKDALKLANEIMENLGGEPLNAKDLNSSASDL